MRAVPYLVTLLVLGGAFLLLFQKGQNPAERTGETASASGGPRTFYVDRHNGDDRGTGLTEIDAWQTLGAVRRASLAPGDQVLLRRGQTWRESLTLTQSGTAEQPIVVGAYGEGELPALRGSDTFEDPAAWREDGAGRWYLLGIADDPGMLVYDGAYGTRRTSPDDLRAPWDFYHDGARNRLYVKLAANPASVAGSIEVPVREFVIGPLEPDHITLQDLDIGHGRNMGLLAWDSDHLTVTRCRFRGSPGNHIQFQNGSNHGVVTHTTFDDWNLRDELSYAIQVIAEQSGPVDIADCVFEASRRGGGKDHTAIMNDYDGWVRTVRDCRFVGNGGALADEGVVIWRPAATADSVTIEGNHFTGLGGTAIIVQELGHYGAALAVRVLRNRIENVCLGDDLDKEALRARQFGAESTVLIAYNLVDGTATGRHPHAGIGVQEAAGIQLVNNVVRGADIGIELKRDIDGAFLRNNIVIGNRAAGIHVGATVRGLDEDYNGLHGNGGGDMVGASPGPHTLLADPRLDARLALSPESPFVGAGVLVEGLRKDLAGNPVPGGASPNMGVFEGGRGRRERGKSAPAALLGDTETFYGTPQAE